jgi:hypothetical protein
MGLMTSKVAGRKQCLAVLKYTGRMQHRLQVMIMPGPTADGTDLTVAGTDYLVQTSWHIIYCI